MSAPFCEVEDYTGLVHKTAALVVSDPVHPCEDDFDDVVQVLYIKVWYALRRYDSSKSRMTLQRFIFMCVRNQVKDLQKKRRRGELSLEELIETVGSLGFQSRDSFDAKYLASAGDDVYAEVEAEPMLLPNTLTALEREVVLALTEGYTQPEVRLHLEIEKRDMERVMRAVRTKLADWKPSGQVVPVALAA